MNECSECGIEFAHEPVFDASEVHYVGRANARTWCSDKCHSKESEAAGVARIAEMNE